MGGRGLNVALFCLLAGCLLISDSVAKRPKQTKYYEVLEVEPEASMEAVKKSYRALAKEYHPDRRPNDPDAMKKFQAIADAYEVLSDEKKRLIYDEQGEAGLKGSRFEWSKRTWSNARRRAGDAVKKIWSFGFKIFNIEFDFQFTAK
uniref:J domain-containing protein n=1 Tax=Rhodosorus marinus TaxID=101924 RepID=A0A7S0BF04_9RHOD|mmetsp:Transcript_12251/g.17785  ORF Transcript_12251/g.17785 Transcript_12251/m.17785 type:complete len:147 (+) Transcript_12251:114-554(+)|eukprot:CAMPEP_0184737866 /NCGR_PEP_ID=MMETSP0315-20130426/629_1 /TAXON_ID=101924 /ORGANISM="Rhodosorus marinus, Strain UTEX LB 2760" /LENGTH=146 /DNA_ID=CAMNT_0027205301 /DNA_START=115 /DNA_END=555 /DNA_ORIENTATION=+